MYNHAWAEQNRHLDLIVYLPRHFLRKSTWIERSHSNAICFMLHRSEWFRLLIYSTITIGICGTSEMYLKLPIKTFNFPSSGIMCRSSPDMEHNSSRHTKCNSELMLFCLRLTVGSLAYNCTIIFQCIIYGCSRGFLWKNDICLRKNH